MRQLTPGAQIDELRGLLRISEQCRQRAEGRLADRERQLNIAAATIAELDQQIGQLRDELTKLRDEALSSPREVAHDDGQLALISECGLPNEMWA
jgi:chromosome segregation ATPase